jgi:hypothetical protein
MEMHLRLYAAADSGTTLLQDLTMDKVVDPVLGGTAGATGIGRKAVCFAAEVLRGVAYFVAVDTGTVNAGTPSGKRELRLCRPWEVVVHAVPATS